MLMFEQPRRLFSLVPANLEGVTHWYFIVQTIYSMPICGHVLGFLFFGYSEQFCGNILKCTFTASVWCFGYILGSELTSQR